jgi:hydrogenase maturation factor
MLNRFHRLMSELAHGVVGRSGFEPWEVEILMDIKSCKLEPRGRSEIMRQYQRAVERQLETGPGPPVKLSHFLIMRGRAR